MAIFLSQKTEKSIWSPMVIPLKSTKNFWIFRNRAASEFYMTAIKNNFNLHVLKETPTTSSSLLSFVLSHAFAVIPVRKPSPPPSPQPDKWRIQYLLAFFYKKLSQNYNFSAHPHFHTLRPGDLANFSRILLAVWRRMFPLSDIQKARTVSVGLLMSCAYSYSSPVSVTARIFPPVFK